MPELVLHKFMGVMKEQIGVIMIRKVKKEEILTIIVPAYNVEKYLEQCLDSLVHQTDQNFRVILVNDGSTDATPDICRRYVSRHGERFRCITQENKGLGAARNTGFSEADTPYVAFLDSDDWQDIRFVEKFCRLMDGLDYEPDIIFTLPRCYDEASHQVFDWMDKPLYDTIFGGEASQSLNCLTHPEIYLLEVNANRKIYRTGFLRENRFAFPEGVKWEDIRPHIQLCHLAKSIAALADTGFIYRTNHGGQITAGTGAGRLDIIPVFEDVLGVLAGGIYEKKELSAVMEMLCRYSVWMIQMTNAEYIGTLLEGLHRVYDKIPREMADAFCQCSSLPAEEKNRNRGLIQCLREGDYHGLTYYEDRENLYRYWSIHGEKKKGIIRGGIQCIKDSGLKYTVKLFFRKLFSMRV